MKHSQTHYLSRLILGYVLLNLLLAAFAGIVSYQQYSNARSAAVIATSNICQILERNITGIIGEGDHALLTIKDEYEQQLANGRIDENRLNLLITRQHGHLNSFDSLRIADAGGRIAHGVGAQPGPTLTVNDRDYFIALRNNAGAGIVISRPVLGRISQQWVIIVARRLNRPDGAFAGVVFGALPIEIFTRMFAGINLGKHGAIALRDERMEVIARHPSADASGKPLKLGPVSKEFQRLWAEGRTEASYFTPASSDKVARLVAYRKFGSYPLHLIVGLYRDEYTAGWWRNAKWLAVFMLISIIGTAIAMRQVYRSRMRELAAMDSVAEAKNRLENIIDFLPDATMVIDNQKRVIAWNRAMEEMTGIPKEQMLGQGDYACTVPFYGERRKHLFDLLDASDAKLESCYSDVLRHEDTIYAEAFAPALRNGQGAHIWIAGSPLLDVPGNRTGFIEVLRDITGRKELEEQLRQSQKMESIGRLAGGVAHDFNNMLSVILGAAELSLLTVPADGELGQNLTAIKSAAERSCAITRQLLAFSRKEVIAPKPVNLNRLIIEAEKNLGRLIGEDVTLAFKPAMGLWTVLADPSQVDQILMNLSVNARDAMPDGGCLTIETANVTIDDGYSHYHPDARPGDYVQLTVSDMGHGMDSETRKHIFEPFFTTKAIGRGTGLGLATVYGIVTQNNGFINVYSEPGQGTVFRIYLPRLPEEQAEPAPPADALTLPAETGTILLVEDEEMLLWMTTKLLEEMGYTVIQAQSPQAALEICGKGEPIDLILTDVVMPEMNGRAMIDKITISRPGIKVLFMSGYTSDIVAQRGIVEEGMHYIQKPLDMQRLHEKIRVVMAAGVTL